MRVPPSSPAVVVRRGAGIDAWHSASIAVVDASGKLQWELGDPELVVMARSSIKPCQTLPLVLSGAADSLGLSREEVTIACSSHSGTDAHVRVVRGLLAKAHADVEDLQCGAHWPLGLQHAGVFPKWGEEADRLRSNCSGKHAGFLALGRHLGADPKTYLDPAGPVQQTVAAAVAEACEVDVGSLLVGIDGCSAPNFALPLVALARGMKNVANPACAPPSLQPALARIREAMWAHAELVSGYGRLDHELMLAFPGNVVCKSGAEGLQLVAFRDPPIGFAVKIHDGNARALAPLCVAILAQLNIWRPGAAAPLSEHVQPLLYNNTKSVVGRLEVTMTLVPSSRGAEA
ncbi:MAG TPA: asparaginase [Polyangiaceae bacterium]|nr:asparaginase [Polyangiaceae bacterium]